jgi:hypothetical protein
VCVCVCVCVSASITAGVDVVVLHVGLCMYTYILRPN